jgi:hypothetical protein
MVSTCTSPIKAGHLSCGIHSLAQSPHLCTPVEMAQQQLKYVDKAHAYVDRQVKKSQVKITYSVRTLWAKG